MALVVLWVTLELYHGGAWFMVYTSGAVSIEHKGVARVFYSKEKPRVYHKPQATPWYNCLVQCNRAQGLIWARIVHVAIRLQRSATPNRKNLSNPAYALKGRGRFSWGRRFHSCRCELLSLVVATCVETIADAEQQLNKTV